MAQAGREGSGLKVLPHGRQSAGAQQPALIGWWEWLAIPEWGLARIKAKIDTGARTSALHAEQLHFFHRDGKDMVRFKVHPLQRSLRNAVIIEAEMVDQRVVRSSNGEEDLRPVVLTYVELGGVCWPIEVTLARRKMMGFRMLLGREAMRDRFVVDPSRFGLAGLPSMPLSRPKVMPAGEAQPPARPEAGRHAQARRKPGA